ncbi:MAG: LAGLIDADG family homing endonuclease [Candidatus Woesearchaeota archaeon]|nr:MAG: LAGLIDADG family homing endonuclease [Candidatus Woesearchaeota archaeon]
MNSEEARIVAHVCGDGWLSTYIEKNALHIVNGRKYYQNRRRYQIGYCNTQDILLREFEKDMIKQFGLYARKVRNEFRFRSKRVFKKISELGGGKSDSWFISKEVFNSDKTIKMEWIRAFFDDECTFDIISKRIRIKSTNKKGLNQVMNLLLDLKIPSNVTGPNKGNTFYLTIKKENVLDFHKIIKLKHREKRDKILKFIKENENNLWC